MTTTSETWSEELVHVAGADVQLVTGGTGGPLLILHDETGQHDMLRFHESLAEKHLLYLPSHPGFGSSPRIEWIMTVRDLAGWYLRALDDLDLGPVNVMGFSMGGWLAAEMAAMCPHQFKKMVLVGPPGIKPPTGDIYDMFLEVMTDFIITSVLDPDRTDEFQRVCPDEPSPERLESWEVAREEACRLAWKPFMYDAALPHLLHRVKDLPTLIVWGRQDAIVPVSAAGVYHESIRGSRLAILEDCGHRPEIEKPADFTDLVDRFLSES